MKTLLADLQNKYRDSLNNKNTTLNPLYNEKYNIFILKITNNSKKKKKKTRYYTNWEE